MRALAVCGQLDSRFHDSGPLWRQRERLLEEPAKRRGGEYDPVIVSAEHFCRLLSLYC